MSPKMIETNDSAQADLDHLTSHILLLVNLLDLDPRWTIEHEDNRMKQRLAKAMQAIVEKAVEVSLKSPSKKPRQSKPLVQG
jgi:hypothetical protein